MVVDDISWGLERSSWVSGIGHPRLEGVIIRISRESAYSLGRIGTRAYIQHCQIGLSEFR
jgi:hypothetical protein